MKKSVMLTILLLTAYSIGCSQSNITGSQKRAIVEMAVRCKHDSIELVFFKERTKQLEANISVTDSINTLLKGQVDSTYRLYLNAMDVVKSDSIVIENMHIEFRKNRRKLMLSDGIGKLTVIALIIFLFSK